MNVRLVSERGVEVRGGRDARKMVLADVLVAKGGSVGAAAATQPCCGVDLVLVVGNVAEEEPSAAK